MKKILVTGATGFVGCHLVKSLLKQNFCVRVLTMAKDPHLAKISGLDIEIIEGDLRDLASLRKAVSNVNIVYHCAALVTDWAPKKLFVEVNVNGTKNLLKACVEENIERYIGLSTNDVFGLVENEVIDESYPYKKWHEPYADSKIVAEKITWQCYREHNLPVSLVYPCWIYGPQDTTFVPLIADAIIKKQMIFWRRGTLLWPTYIDNLIDLLLVLAQNDKGIGHGFLVHDGKSTTFEDFCKEIAASLNYQLTKRYIPYPITYLTAICFENIWKLFRIKNRPLLTTYSVKNLGSQLTFSISKAEKILEWTPKVTFSQGLNHTLSWLKEQPLSSLKTK